MLGGVVNVRLTMLYDDRCETVHTVESTEKSPWWGTCGTLLGWVVKGEGDKTHSADRVGTATDEPATCLWCVAEREK